MFNFTTGQHNVAKVTKAAFDACTTANPISMVTTGPATITLNETGSHYYVCTIEDHCSLGQKLAVNVSSASSPPSPSTSSSPPPSGATSAPPNPGASSLGVAGFSAALLSIAAALLY